VLEVHLARLKGLAGKLGSFHAIHRREMQSNHLRRQHGFDLIGWIDAMKKSENAVEGGFVDRLGLRMDESKRAIS
jgi:hypothetical protein